MAKVTLTINAN